MINYLSGLSGEFIFIQAEIQTTPYRQFIQKGIKETELDFVFCAMKLTLEQSHPSEVMLQLGTWSCL